MHRASAGRYPHRADSRRQRGLGRMNTPLVPAAQAGDPYDLPCAFSSTAVRCGPRPQGGLRWRGPGEAHGPW